MQSRRNFYKVLSLMCLFTLTFPFVMLLEALLFKEKQHIPGILFSLVMLLGGIALEYIFHHLINPDSSTGKWHILLLRFASLLSYSIPVILSFLIFNDGKTVFFAIIGIMYFAISSKGYYLDYFDIINTGSIFLYIALLIISLLAGYFLDSLAHLIFLNEISTYIGIFLVLLLYNQNNLDNQFSSSAEQSSGEPAGVRIYNFRVVLIMCLSLFTLLNFRRIISFLFSSATYVILQTLLKLRLSRFYRASPLPQQNNGLMMPGIGNSTPVSAIVIVVIVIIPAILFLFIKREKIKQLFTKFLMWFRKLYSGGKAAADPGNLYFDKVEDIAADTFLGVPESKGHKAARNFKVLGKITDPVLKMRYIYGMMLDTLVKLHIVPNRSDTAREIQLKKELPENVGKHTSLITDIYEKSRYGNSKPSEEEIYESENRLKDFIKTFTEARRK